MHTRSCFLAIILSVSILGGCKKDDEEKPTPTPADTTGSVAFQVSNRIGNQDLALGYLSYVNAAGDSFQVDLLKYYISGFEWKRADGTYFQSKNYQLINASQPTSLNFSLTGIPNGTYTGLRFYLGVDSLSNHTLTNNAALDASSGMIWSWNTGYIFFKHEGKYIDSNQVEKPLLFHYGTDRGFATVDLPLDNFVVNSDSRQLNLTFDLAALYANPNMIDFNIWNNNQSLTTQEYPWLDAMKQNFSQSFSVHVP